MATMRLSSDADREAAKRLIDRSAPANRRDGRMIQHFVSISGGKDSDAVACIARERQQRRPDFRPRYQFVDVDHEHQLTVDRIGYLECVLESPIERLSAYDVPGLIDDAAFERRRQSIIAEWPNEKRWRRHTAICKAAKAALPPAARHCRPSAERMAAVRAWAAACEDGCPIVVSPAMPDWRIQEAVAAMYSRGNAFFDLCLIHGRFPSKMAKFCTEELKLAPMEHSRRPVWDAGGTTCEWIGERGQESAARGRKPIIERHRRPTGGTQIMYRPIRDLKHEDVFAIARRHGIRPNPLYLMGASRVGCWLCINAGKEEIRLAADLTPERIDLIRDYEAAVQVVSRRSIATFFHAGTIPTDDNDAPDRAHIDAVVEWSRTGRGGRNFDLFATPEARDPLVCVSKYALCE